MTEKIRTRGGGIHNNDKRLKSVHQANYLIDFLDITQERLESSNEQHKIQIPSSSRTPDKVCSFAPISLFTIERINLSLKISD